MLKTGKFNARTGINGKESQQQQRHTVGSVERESQEDPVPSSVWVREQPRFVQGANPEAELASGQSADKKASPKSGQSVPKPQMSRVRSRSPPRFKAPYPPIHEGSRKEGSNLFQHLDVSDDNSTTDDQRSQKDGEFQIPRKSAKKKNSKKSEGKTEDQKSEPQTKAETMDEDEVDATERGTTKRARTAKSESEDEKSEEIAPMREMLKEMSAKFEDQLAKKEEENERLRDEMKKMSNQSNIDT
uniref:Protein IWS1 homolog n=1 Tax=Diabrotica virgifera virgifera TaxID=50390 RepID=A0A6P7GVG5_DIAVI